MTGAELPDRHAATTFDLDFCQPQRTFATRDHQPCLIGGQDSAWFTGTGR